MIKSIIGPILFACICAVVFLCVSWLGLGFLSWFAGLILVKQIAIFVMLGSFIWLLFKGLRNALVNLSTRFFVGRGLTSAIIIAFSVINGYMLIYSSWMNSGSHTGRQIVPDVFFLVLVLEIVIAPLYDLSKITNKTFFVTKIE